MTTALRFSLSLALLVLVIPQAQRPILAQAPAMVHDQLFNTILVGPDATAVQDGSFADPATWGGSVPTERQRLLIPAGLTVTVDTEVATAYNWIRVDGTLRFAPSVATKLIAETVAGMGVLEMGTAAQPIACNVTAKLIFRSLGGAIEHVLGSEFATYADPLELTRGLIMGGPSSIYGCAKKEIITLQDLPAAGATQVTLQDDPTGWVVGDEMLVNPTLWGQDEVVTVTAIDGRTITFAPALKYTRQNVPSDLLSQLTTTFAKWFGYPVGVHVGNLTRNVVIQTDPSQAGGPSGRLLQGHVMFMGGGHRVHNAAFLDTGRTVIRALYAKPGQTVQWNFAPVTDPIITSDGTRAPQLMPICGAVIENIRGRYSLHFHNPGPGSAPSYAEGNVVRVARFMGFKIGIQNHSAFVYARRNIVHQIDGSGLFTEFGNERGEYTMNMVTHSLGGHSGAQSPDLGSDACPMNNYPEIFKLRVTSYGWKGAGGWAQGNDVLWRGNICAGHDQGCIDHESEGVTRRGTLPPTFIRPDYLRLGFGWFAAFMFDKFKKVIDPTVPVLVEREPVLELLDNQMYAMGAAHTPPYVKNARYGSGACIVVGTGLQLTDYAGYRPKNRIADNVCWNVSGHAITAAYSSYNRVENFWSFPGLVTPGSRFSSATCRGGINPNTQNGQAWTYKNVHLNAGAVPNCGFQQLGPISVVLDSVTVNGKPYVPTIEACEDGIDNDTDGATDEGCLPKETLIAPPPDTTPPIATVTSATSVSQTQHTIAVASNEPATVTVTLDEETEPRCSGPTPLSCPITLTAWPRTATITLTDAAGNTAPPTTVPLTRP